MSVQKSQMTTKVLIQLPLAKRVAGGHPEEHGRALVQDWVDKNKRDRKDTRHPESGKEKASKTQGPSVTEPMSTQVHTPDLEATSACSSCNLPGAGPETTSPQLGFRELKHQSLKGSVFCCQHSWRRYGQILGNSLPL